MCNFRSPFVRYSRLIHVFFCSFSPFADVLLTALCVLVIRSTRIRITDLVTCCCITSFRFGHASGARFTTITSGSKVSSITDCKIGEKHLENRSLPSFVTVRKQSCGKVRFSTVCVKNSVHRGGVCQTPSWADTPPADTPSRHPQGQMATAADRTHPTGMHSC